MTRTGARDGFPSKVYTIMASGRPVLASAEAGSEMAWIVRESGGGRVVPPEEPAEFLQAVLKAYEHREELAGEGERGRAFVETAYSKQAIARQYDALIKELTRPPASR